MQIRPETMVAEVASAHPATIRVFQKHGVDFCCGGKRPLEQVCGEQGLRFETLRVDLEAALAGAPADERSWSSAPLDQLVAHIVDRYHEWLREEMPRLSRMMDKVLAVHGQRHPELAAIAATYGELVNDLMPHMMKEERVLFPFIAELERCAGSGQPAPAAPFGSLDGPIGMMEYEHEAVGRLLVGLRERTRGYEPPADACNTFRGLYHGFSELERELHEHIHVENNILHPRARALAERLKEARAGRA